MRGPHTTVGALKLGRSLTSGLLEHYRLYNQGVYITLPGITIVFQYSSLGQSFVHVNIYRYFFCILAGAGALNEDMFTKSFDQVPKINVSMMKSDV